MIQRGLDDFMWRKQSHLHRPTLEQLRAGWDLALDLALKRPALYGLLAQHALAQPAMLTDACGLMQARVQRLVDMGRFRGPVDAAARALLAASQGVLPLVRLVPARRDREQVSDLLFKAVVAELSRPAR